MSSANAIADSCTEGSKELHYLNLEDRYAWWNFYVIEVDESKGVVYVSEGNEYRKKVKYKRTSRAFVYQKKLFTLSDNCSQLRLEDAKTSELIVTLKKFELTPCAEVGSTKLQLCPGDTFSIANSSPQRRRNDLREVQVLVSALKDENDQLVAVVSKHHHSWGKTNSAYFHKPTLIYQMVRFGENCVGDVCIGDVRHALISDPFREYSSLLLKVVGFTEDGFNVVIDEASTMGSLAMALNGWYLPKSRSFVVSDLGANREPTSLFIKKKLVSDKGCDDITPNQKKVVLDDLGIALRRECRLADSNSDCHVRVTNWKPDTDKLCEFTVIAMRISSVKREDI
jgi:hypothetical protein